jgi:type IV pilus assembly protein PilC
VTAFVGKIRDVFSDLFLEIELFVAKIFPKKKSVEHTPAMTKTPAKPVETMGVKPSETPLVTPAPVTTKAIPVANPDEKGKEKKEKLPFGLRMLRMSVKERLFFYDQMATLIGSGVTLIDSMSLVLAQTKNKGLKKLYEEMIHDVNTGMSMADSMYRFSHIFPRMQAAIVEAAEKSGNLKVVLAELVEEMEAAQDFRKKITGAMFYPVLLLVLALGLVVGMMTFVIPKISAMYEQANVALPALTQKVIDISNYVTTNWQMLLLYIFGGLILLWVLFFKVRFGRLIWEKIISVIPIVGKISKQKNLMMISANMSMLMKSGVLISDAFEITEKTVDNLHYQRALAKIRQGVIMGKEVSEMMGLIDIKTQKFKKNKLFPLQFAQLMHIGESTGKIAEMLVKLKTNYHKSIEYTLRNISTMVEPIMIFIVAALVGTILLAVMLPFFYIGTTIS